MIPKFKFLNPEFNEKNGKILLLLISFAFLAINVFFLTKNIYLFSLLPIILILAYFYLTALDVVFYTTAFFTPLSFNLVMENFNLGISLPAEPLLIGILFIFLFKILYERVLSREMLTHPVSLFIFMQMSWMLICTITSQIPIVSTKYFFMQLWFIIPVFLFGQLIFVNKKKIYLFFILLTISITLTIIYTSFNHALYGFERKAGTWVMEPFYNDHTAYGAILAMMLPIVLGMAIKSNLGKITKLYLGLASLFFFIGIYLSYSRATWVSIILAIGFYFLLVFKIKFRWILLIALFAIGIFYINYNNIMMKLEENRQDSSAHFVEHVQSIANIRTDASNLERINRWKAAFRMFNDYPMFGTGPGTYQFLYAPYQKARDRTIISTDAGDLGNAHSEYITPLVERGVLGLVFFLLIIISVYTVGIRAYQRLKDKELKLIIAAILTGLFSYLMHGFMNNFLDTESASVIFWGFIAIIVKLSLYSKRENNEAINNQNYQFSEKTEQTNS